MMYQLSSINFFLNNVTVFLILHIFFVIVGMGTALVLDVLFNFYAADKIFDVTEQKTLTLLSTIVWISLVCIILSGVTLFLADPVHYIHSQKFISKMLVLLVLLVNSTVLFVAITPHFKDTRFLVSTDSRLQRQLAFVCGTVSVVSWIVIMILGMLDSIPFLATQFFVLYSVLLFFAILVTLEIEKRTYEKNV